MNELKNNVVDVSVSTAVSQNQALQAKKPLVSGSQNLSSSSVSQQADASSEKVKEAVSRIKEYVQQTQRTLDFELDETSGKAIIRVYDKASSELIRQIPSELALELAQRLNDEESSILFSAQV